MKRKIAIATICALAFGATGCVNTAVGLVGNVVEGVVKTPFVVVDKVTTSDEEQMKKDWKKEKAADKKAAKEAKKKG